MTTLRPDFRAYVYALAPYFFNNTTDMLNAADAMVDMHQNMEYVSHIREVDPNLLAIFAIDSRMIMNELLNDRKITAIKRLREMTSCGLKAAKEAIESDKVQSHLQQLKHAEDPWLPIAAKQNDEALQALRDKLSGDAKPF